MVRKHLIALMLNFLVGLYGPLINANPVFPKEVPKSPGLGLAVGGLSLLGISYRQFFLNGLGFQTTVGGFPVSDYLDTFASMFLTYKIYEKPSLVRLYLMLGTGAILESNLNLSMNPGAGIGFEYFVRENFVLDFNLGLAPIIHVNHAQHMLGYIPWPLPGTAIIYYF